MFYLFLTLVVFSDESNHIEITFDWKIKKKIYIIQLVVNITKNVLFNSKSALLKIEYYYKLSIYRITRVWKKVKVWQVCYVHGLSIVRNRCFYTFIGILMAYNELLL